MLLSHIYIKLFIVTCASQLCYRVKEYTGIFEYAFVTIRCYNNENLPWKSDVESHLLLMHSRGENSIVFVNRGMKAFRLNEKLV